MSTGVDPKFLEQAIEAVDHAHEVTVDVHLRLTRFDLEAERPGIAITAAVPTAARSSVITTTAPAAVVRIEVGVEPERIVGVITKSKAVAGPVVPVTRIVVPVVPVPDDWRSAVNRGAGCRAAFTWTAVRRNCAVGR